MGNISSFTSKKEKMMMSPVELQLEESRLQGLLNFKLLLLGAGECGKSTVLKQVKLVHKIGFTDNEMKDFCVNLRRNTIQSMQCLIEACKTVEPSVPIDDPELLKHSQLVLNFKFSNELAEIPENVLHAIQECWKSKPIKEIWERRTEFWCLDSIDYYFENVSRFCEPNFVPDEQDCIMARIITTGIVSTEIKKPPVLLQLIDVGGQRNERRKWMHCFDDVTAIIYLVNLGGYASVLYEDPKLNRMMEDLDLFSTTLNSKIFENTPIYLILNKKDLFEATLQKKPLSTCFPEYQGSENVVEALDFLSKKFSEQLKNNPERLQTHAIAARFKRDVKIVWEEISADLQKVHEKEINEALSGLSKIAKLKESIGKNDKKKESSPKLYRFGKKKEDSTKEHKKNVNERVSEGKKEENISKNKQNAGKAEYKTTELSKKGITNEIKPVSSNATKELKSQDASLISEEAHSLPNEIINQNQSVNSSLNSNQCQKTETNTSIDDVCSKNEKSENNSSECVSKEKCENFNQQTKSQEKSIDKIENDVLIETRGASNDDLNEKIMNKNENSDENKITMDSPNQKRLSNDKMHSNIDETNNINEKNNFDALENSEEVKEESLTKELEKDIQTNMIEVDHNNSDFNPEKKESLTDSKFNDEETFENTNEIKDAFFNENETTDVKNRPTTESVSENTIVNEELAVKSEE